MPVWYDDPTIAHRLGHPFTYPGGPSAVAEPAAARRQTVQQFQEQASSAWQQLVATVEAGLQEQAENDDDAGSSQPPAGLQDTRLPPLPQQMRTQQQQSQRPRQQQQTGLDLSGIAVPLLPRRRLTGPILLVPQPATTPPGMTPAQATAAAVAAARAAQPLNGDTLEALLVPAGCLQLSSWQESAAAEEPPGIVASSSTQPRRAAAAGDAAGDVLAPGSEVVVTLVVMDTSRQLSSVQQEIQALGSNTLSELRDAISCPTDKLAEGLGASNAAAYFYINQCFYDDTRAAAAAECSEVVKQWVHRFGFAGPKHLLRHYEPPEEPGAQPLLPLPAPPPPPPLLPLPAPQQDQQQQAMGAAGGSGGPAVPMAEQPADEPMQEAGDLQQQQPQPQQQQQDEGFAHLERQLALLEQQHQEHQQQHQQQQPPPGREMQHVTLRELVMQASNRPIALFSHQGLCEHAVLISDVRLLHAADPNRRSDYPRTVFQASLGRRLHCGVCKRVGATALMLDHPETPEAVIVLCRLCCGLFSVEQYPQAKLVMLEPFPFQHQQ